MLFSRCGHGSRVFRLSSSASVRLAQRRSLLTLAIETSCDDTSVAILEKEDTDCKDVSVLRDAPRAILHFHEKVTADNRIYGGIHPIKSLESHQVNLATLVAKALRSLPPPKDGSVDPFKTVTIGVEGSCTVHQKPTFISVTRGPGMRSSLATGLDTAKGLATAWSIPVIGVHHMQGHLLVNRLVSALRSGSKAMHLTPEFPFLTLLVSGGHTTLLHSRSLTDHAELASTADIAIGDSIDKLSRSVLPPELLASSSDTNYGRILESYAFPSPVLDYAYSPPLRRQEELVRQISRWGWGLAPPLSQTKVMEFSFSGIESTVRRIMETRGAQMCEDERRDLAREAMRVLFEHLAGRTVIALKQLETTHKERTNTLVVSGGVAANKYLKHILRAFLNIRGFEHVELEVPPLALFCTDNAAMIAWAGMEMWEAGWESETSQCLSQRIWGLDPKGEYGGILGIGGWKRRNNADTIVESN